MRILVQRVAKASVTVSGNVLGKIEQGLLVFYGVAKADREESIGWLANKLVGLRIFSDEEGKMNKSVGDIGGGILIISQFTLYANCLKGKRPSFIDSAPPEIANEIYRKFIKEVKALHPIVEEGEFGGDMQVELINDGPVTLIIDAP